MELSESLFPAQNDNPLLRLSIGELLQQTAQNIANEIALIEILNDGSRGRCWSYQELLQDATYLAVALNKRFKPGQRITVWADNQPENMLCQYAAALAGLVLVTANPSYQVAELRYVLENSESSALLFLDSEHSDLASIAAQASEGLPQLHEVIDLLAFPLDKTETASALPTVEAESAAQIHYTSGTTGHPKGAVLSHAGLINNARFFIDRLGLQQSSVWANVMPLYHTSGCVLGVLGCLQAGCRMLLLSHSDDPEYFCRVVAREQATASFTVPSMLSGIVDLVQQQRAEKPSSLEVMVCGGAQVAPKLVERVQQHLQCLAVTTYGQTEASSVITQHSLTEPADALRFSVGRPLPHTALSIRGIKDNQVVGTNEVGEVCVKGESVMLGYLNDDAATRDTIDNDGWLHTGDLGAMSKDGYLRITGRIKEMIIRGGANFYPAEIEKVLLEHPKVSDVAVLGIPDATWGEAIACFVQPEADEALLAQELHDYCLQRLSAAKTPGVWVQLNALPLAESGEVQKFKLRERYLAGAYQPL